MVFPAIVADICNCVLEKGTVSKDGYCTPSKEHYGNSLFVWALHIFNMLPVSWSEIMWSEEV